MKSSPIKDIEDLFARAQSSTVDKETLLKFSARGPLERLAVKRLSVGKQPTSEQETQFVWDVFNPHLMKEMTKVPEDTLDLEMAVMSMQAFTIALKDCKPTRLLVSRIRTSWARFFNWLSFFVTNIGERSMLSYRLQGQMFMTVHEFYAAAIDREALFKMIQKSSGTIPLLAKCWSLEVSHPNIFRPSNPPQLQFPAAWTLRAYLDPLDPRHYEELKSVLNPVSTARVTLDHLARTTNETDLDSIYANVCNLLNLGRDKAFETALRDEDPIREVTRIFYSFTRHTPLFVSKKFGTCVTKCRFYLVRALDTSFNLAWIMQAVEGHLLAAILQSVHCEPDSRQIALNMVRRVVPRYMIFSCVIHAVIKSIRMIEADGMENRMILLPGYPKTLWNSFKRLAANRMSYALQVDKSLSLRNMCSWTLCRRVDIENNFKRCQGCSEVFYCSRACQRQDWEKGTHRSYCKERIRQGDRKSNMMTKRDWLVVAAIVRAEVKSQQERVVEYLHLRQWKPIVVEVEHTQYPTKIIVDHSTKYRPEYDYDEQGRDWWQRTIEMEQAAGTGIIVRAWIPGMDGAKSSFNMFRKGAPGQHDGWVCIPAADGKSLVRETWYIHSGLVDMDPVWNMAFDIEC